MEKVRLCCSGVRCSIARNFVTGRYRLTMCRGNVWQRCNSLARTDRQADKNGELQHSTCSQFCELRVRLKVRPPRCWRHNEVITVGFKRCRCCRCLRVRVFSLSGFSVCVWERERNVWGSDGCYVECNVLKWSWKYDSIEYILLW